MPVNDCLQSGVFFSMLSHFAINSLQDYYYAYLTRRWPQRPGKEMAVKTSQKYNKYRIKYKLYDIIYNKQIAII